MIMTDKIMLKLRKDHSLTLPDWGPYSKNYAGISHIPNSKSGMRFDFTIMPGLFRRKIAVPNVNYDSGFSPVEAKSDLSYYSYRIQLEWKDRVYVDTDYYALDENVRLVEIRLVNNTGQDKSLMLHCLASMTYPLPAYAELDCECDDYIWLDALNYASFEYIIKGKRHGLVYDGLIKGQIPNPLFISGWGLGFPDGSGSGLYARYSVSNCRNLSKPVLLIRYCSKSKFLINVDKCASKSHLLHSCDTPTLLSLGRIDCDGDDNCFCIKTDITRDIQIDGFVICEQDKVDKVKFRLKPNNTNTGIKMGRDSFNLVYNPDEPMEYAVVWGKQNSVIRQYLSNDIDTFIQYCAHNHINEVLSDQRFNSHNQQHYIDVFFRPIIVKASSTETVRLLIVSEPQECIDYNKMLDEVDDERINASETNNAIGQSESAGMYDLMYSRMSSLVLTNLVYPVKFKRGFIKHYSPGKWWDSLYTWDSGFTGIGLAELDLERAVECLAAYLSNENDKDFEFVHHGTPIPVQIYLFNEIWNKTQDMELLRALYSGLRRYYNYLSGNHCGSTTNKFKSNILQTADYFYNAGGWDDYPPQKYCWENPAGAQLGDKLAWSVSPVCTSSHIIRAALFLQRYAILLGYKEDVSAYSADIEKFTNALLKYSWDVDSGYFSYVIHDNQMNPVDILRHQSGKNFNMGLDGVSPLLAADIPDDIIEMMLANLTDTSKLWSKIGISTVDMSAPYYSSDGYWNGAVWFPHQWFIWKRCLDLNEVEFATKIAFNALNLMNKHIEYSYNCYEHFMIDSGDAAGWHQFTGLSCPILCWKNAYHKQGYITCGFDVIILHIDEDESNIGGLNAQLQTYKGRNGFVSVLVSLNNKSQFQSTWNGNLCETTDAGPYAFYAKIPANSKGILSVKKTLF